MQDVGEGLQVVSDSDLSLLLQRHLNINVDPFLSSRPPEQAHGKKKPHARVICLALIVKRG